MKQSSVLMIPGIGNSGPTHWQSLWESKDVSMSRLAIADWDHPSCNSWVTSIDEYVSHADSSLVVVAHSIGCLAFVHWAARYPRRIRGALLVAVPDPSGSRFPVEAEGFEQIPWRKIPCKSIVVLSQDDPYASPEFVRSCAWNWGSVVVDIGHAGHINGSSNLSEWPTGMALLNKLRTSREQQ
jgi:uncharacterized protein